ncbi:hypothetical protein [Leisingera methylohalidivorans]|uniref:Uncharacterized protein n=1 Tax=Leisingera methylohalidivorans DSM 14336 TaxID=999552 RepID=V9VTY8_9RHOB|nr:hypothetical protein [Leisingera methylohalidivorans]AHD01488.1 hypothetical protein METH_13070 [Leisingera methylohalidivorans DSM 14336]
MKIAAAAALCASLLLVAFPDSSAAGASRHSIRVNPVSDGVFEVIPNTGNGYLFWCGAADYAQRSLRVSRNSMLHITRGLGRSETTGRRSAVQFTLDPDLAPAAPAGGYGSVNSLQSGDTMSVQEALGYCFIPFGRP